MESDQIRRVGLVSLTPLPASGRWVPAGTGKAWRVELFTGVWMLGHSVKYSEPEESVVLVERASLNLVTFAAGDVIYLERVNLPAVPH